MEAFNEVTSADGGWSLLFTFVTQLSVIAQFHR